MGGLSDEISAETGKSLRDSAENVGAWASLHRVQQFRFFGIPGRQAYRELRLLAGQALRNQSDKKAGAPVLENAQLDAVLAAADVGCFATYIMKQGGVLVPRKHHIVRTAYELNDEPTPYGDHGTRIYGIWSPLVAGRICTHSTKWKMVRKAVDVQEATADQGASAPWTRGNNCPPDEKLNISGGNPVSVEPIEPGETPLYGQADFDNMTRKQRRDLLARLRVVKPCQKKGYKQQIDDDQRALLVAELQVRGFTGEEMEINLLLAGGSLNSGAGMRIFYRNGRLQEDDKWRQWI